MSFLVAVWLIVCSCRPTGKLGGDSVPDEELEVMGAITGELPWGGVAGEEEGQLQLSDAL